MSRTSCCWILPSATVSATEPRTTGASLPSSGTLLVIVLIAAAVPAFRQAVWTIRLKRRSRSVALSGRGRGRLSAASVVGVAVLRAFFATRFFGTVSAPAAFDIDRFGRSTVVPFAAGFLRVAMSAG